MDFEEMTDPEFLKTIPGVICAWTEGSHALFVTIKSTLTFPHDSILETEEGYYYTPVKRQILVYAHDITLRFEIDGESKRFSLYQKVECSIVRIKRSRLEREKFPNPYLTNHGSSEEEYIMCNMTYGSISRRGLSIPEVVVNAVTHFNTWSKYGYHKYGYLPCISCTNTVSRDSVRCQACGHTVCAEHMMVERGRLVCDMCNTFIPTCGVCGDIVFFRPTKIDPLAGETFVKRCARCSQFMEYYDVHTSCYPKLKKQQEDVICLDCQIEERKREYERANKANNQTV